MAGTPDIFLVTIDTLRADHVHCYGDSRIETPAMDGLARDGVRFANAFTPSPITNSSHVSILTGLLPSSHGVTNFGMPLQPEHSTAAQLLKARGYRTAAFIGSVVLDSNAMAPGLASGFDYYDNFPRSSKTQSRWGRLERRGMDVVRHAEAWLDAHPAGPHFVWVHLYDPHDPYEPPPPFSQAYRGRLYDGEIAYADSALGQFVTYLKRHAMYRNALIVVVGDHGEGLGDHGEDTHGIFLYDSTLHVPLILKLPAGKATGQVVAALVRTIDILPTLLDIAAADAVHLDGRSLEPYFVEPNLATGEATNRVAFGETDYPLSFGWAPLRSVRADGFKFIEAPRPELYNLRSDPAESSNRYEPWNETVLKSRALLAEIRARAPQQAVSKGAVDPLTIAELKALGYLGRADIGSATNVPVPSLLPDPKDRIEEQNLLHKSMLASEGGRATEARDTLEKLLQLNPDSDAALRQLGELEVSGGVYSKAIEHLEHARRLRPDDPEAAFYAGSAFQKAGDPDRARGALEASLKLRAGNFNARLLLGQVYLGLKQIGAAEDQFQAALLIRPDSIPAKLGLARARVLGGRFEEAIRQLLELYEIDPKDRALLELLADAYRAVGKTAEARRAEAKSKLLPSRVF
jgi:arylsulfatase A-like enzyme/Flp pilus assembly protein TadD